MSTELIKSIEDALTATIGHKNGLGKDAEKVRKAKPIAESEFDFDSPAALYLKEAEMCLRRAHSECEQATRKMARAIAFVDENAEREEASQSSIFEDEAPEPEPAEPLQLPSASIEEADYELVDDDEEEFDEDDFDDPDFDVEYDEDDDFELDDDVAQLTAIECVKRLRKHGESADVREGVMWLRRRVQQLREQDEPEPEAV